MFLGGQKLWQGSSNIWNLYDAGVEWPNHDLSRARFMSPSRTRMPPPGIGLALPFLLYHSLDRDLLVTSLRSSRSKRRSRHRRRQAQAESDSHRMPLDMRRWDSRFLLLSVNNYLIKWVRYEQAIIFRPFFLHSQELKTILVTFRCHYLP